MGSLFSHACSPSQRKYYDVFVTMKIFIRFGQKKRTNKIGSGLLSPSSNQDSSSGEGGGHCVTAEPKRTGVGDGEKMKKRELFPVFKKDVEMNLSRAADRAASQPDLPFSLILLLSLSLSQQRRQHAP